MTRVIATDAGYLADADFNGQAWVSADGETWENFEAYRDGSPRIDAVAVRGDLIVAIAGSGFGGLRGLVGSLEGMQR
jgi:hypothetical protein